VTEVNIDGFQHLVEGIVWPRGGDIMVWGESEGFGDPRHGAISV
jgi:hypothetical protein